MKRLLASVLLFALAGPALAQEASGKFIDVARSNCVQNDGKFGGNCGWASIETIGRHLGIESLYGTSPGRGGAKPETMAAFLRSRGVEFKQEFRSREKAWALLNEALTDGRPVLFDITVSPVAGHALVCCGVTKDPDGKEWVWVIDNTGPEKLEIMGWSKASFDRRWAGWILAVERCCPPKPGPGPGPKNPKSPHIKPTPDKIPKVDPPVAPPPVPLMPPADDLVQKIIDGVLKSGKLNGKDGANGKDGRPGKDGSNGANGKDGDPGRDGKDGLDGKTVVGPEGKPGRDGQDGRPGRDGVDGKTVVGPAGPIGPPGPMGLPGRDGSDASLEAARLQIQIDALRAELDQLNGAVFKIRVRPKP